MMILPTIRWGAAPSDTGETLVTVVEFTKQKLAMLEELATRKYQTEELATLQYQTVSELMARFLPIEGSVAETEYDPKIHITIILEALYNTDVKNRFNLKERVVFLCYAQTHHVEVVKAVKRNGRYDERCVVADGVEDTIDSWKSASRFKAGDKMVL